MAGPFIVGAPGDTVDEKTRETGGQPRPTLRCNMRDEVLGSFAGDSVTKVARAKPVLQLRRRRSC